MNFYYWPKELTQVADSSQTGEAAFYGAQAKSILRTDFAESKKIHKLVIQNTKKLRPKNEENLPSYIPKSSIIWLKPDTLWLKSGFVNRPEKSHFLPEIQDFFGQPSAWELSKDEWIDEVQSQLKSPNQVVLITPKPVVEAKKIENKPLNTSIWLIIILLAIWFTVATLRFQFKAKIKMYLQSVFSYQQFYKMFKEQNSLSIQLEFFLSLIFYVNGGLMLYFFGVRYTHLWQIAGQFPMFIAAITALAAYFLWFTLSNKFLAYLVESKDLISEYLYSVYYYNRILGVFWVPIVTLYPYFRDETSNYLYFFGLFLWLITTLIRWFRGFEISFKHRVHYLYLFLYLCTLEIVPLMWLYKIILSFN